MRTKLFVSYSHVDRGWMARLRLHIAVLERLGLVDVWSDNRIEVGASWEQEIDAALTAARVAILMISPGFLASDYVWHKEMPLILAHQKNGMRILPVVTSPCAWRLEESLARLQARPLDGRALSTGSEAQIDQDLAALTYELADILGKVPEGVLTTDEREALAVSPTTAKRSPDGSPEMLTTLTSKKANTPFVFVSQFWQGKYSGTDRHMKIEFGEFRSGSFTGRVEYDFGQGETELEGQVVDKGTALDSVWLNLGVESGDVALTFREFREVREGTRSVDFDGEYRAVTSFAEMRVVWMKNGKVISSFVLAALGPFFCLQ